MDIVELLTQTFYPWATFLIIVLAFLTKSFTEFFINKQVEIKKTELAQEIEIFKQKIEYENATKRLELDKDLEGFKSKLEILRLENQIVFSQLHERRSIVIENLYKKLITLDNNLYNLTIPLKYGNDLEKEEFERRSRATEAFNEFNSLYNESRIYFENRTCEILDKLRSDIKKHLNDYTEKDFLKLLGSEPSELRESILKASKVWDKVRTELPQALHLLEDEFRRILGVPNNPRNSDTNNL